MSRISPENILYCKMHVQVWDLIVVGAGVAGAALAHTQGLVRHRTYCAYCHLPAIINLSTNICFHLIFAGWSPSAGFGKMFRSTRPNSWGAPSTRRVFDAEEDELGELHGRYRRTRGLRIWLVQGWQTCMCEVSHGRIFRGCAWP